MNFSRLVPDLGKISNQFLEDMELINDLRFLIEPKDEVGRH